MRLRSIACSAALLTSFMTTTALVPSAVAQKRLLLNPSTDWAVSRIADKDSQGNDYCAMARRFDSNIILTMAKNHNKEMSMAMDFQRPVLRQGEILTVTLDPGAGEQRVYDIDPISNKAVVVRLGKDSAFLSALEHTGLLRVEMRDKSYSFNLSDIDSGSFKLNSCLASATEPAAGGSPQSTSSAYRDEVQELRQQLTDLRHENKRLDALIEEGEQAFEDSQISARKLADQSTEVRELQERVDELEEENRSFIKQLASLKADGASEIALLKSENKKLREKAEDYEVTSDLAREFELQIEILQNEKIGLEENLVRSKENLEEDFEKEIERYKTKNQDLRTALSKNKIDAALIAQLQEQIDDARHENRVLQSAAKERAHESDLAYQRNVERLQETIVELEDSLVQRDVRLLEASEAAVDLETLRHKNAELEARLESAFQKEQDIGKLRMKIAALEKDNAFLSSELLTAVSDFEESGVSIERHAQDIERLRTENTAMAEEIDSLRSENKIQAEALLAAEEVSTKEYEDLQAEAQIYEKEAASLRAENEALQTRIDDLQQEMPSLADLQAENERISADLEQALTKISLYEEEIEAKEEKLAQVTQEKEAALASLQEQGGALEEMAAMQVTLDDLTKENAELKDVIVELQQAPIEVAALKERVGALTEENESLKDDLERVSAEMEVVKYETLASEQARVGKLTEENESLKDDLERVNAEMEIVKYETLVSEQERVGQLTEENETLKDNLERVSAEMEIVKYETLVSEQERVGKLTEENEALKDDLKRVNAEIEIVKYETLVSEQERVHHLERQLEKATLDKYQAMEALTRDYILLKRQEKPAETNLHPVALNAIDPAAGDDREYNTPEGIIAVSTESLLVADQTYPEEVEADTDMPSDKLLQQPVQEEVLEAETELSTEMVPETTAAEEPQGLSEAQQYEAEMTEELAEPAPPILVEQDEPGIAEEQVQLPEAPEVIAQEELKPPEIEQAEPEPISVIEMSAEPEQEPVLDLEPAVYRPNFMVGDALASAAIASAQSIEQVAEASGPQQAVYQWRSGSVYGSAELKPLKVGAFDNMVRDYIARTEARCQGDFAVVPDNTIKTKMGRVESYEVACVGSDVSSSASLLFFDNAGEFGAVAHEASVDDMASAMDIRDRLLQAISGS